MRSHSLSLHFMVLGFYWVAPTASVRAADELFRTNCNVQLRSELIEPARLYHEHRQFYLDMVAKEIRPLGYEPYVVVQKQDMRTDDMVIEISASFYGGTIPIYFAAARLTEFKPSVTGRLEKHTIVEMRVDDPHIGELLPVPFFQTSSDEKMKAVLAALPVCRAYTSEMNALRELLPSTEFQYSHAIESSGQVDALLAAVKALSEADRTLLTKRLELVFFRQDNGIFEQGPDMDFYNLDDDRVKLVLEYDNDRREKEFVSEEEILDELREFLSL